MLHGPPPSYWHHARAWAGGAKRGQQVANHYWRSGLGLLMLLAAFVLLACSVGCQPYDPNGLCPPGGCPPRQYYRSAPPRSAEPQRFESIDIPVELRQSNWRGNRGEGSCVHATVVTLLRYHGYAQTAEDWRRAYANGEHSSRLAMRFNGANLDFAQSTGGSLDVIRWAMRTRRPCGVSYPGPSGGYHCVALVGLNDRYAELIDNNATGRVQRVPTQTFLANWRARGGWSFALFLDPPAPPLWRQLS